MSYLNIQRERIKNDWTLGFVANKLGITNQAVSLIETAKRRPSYDVLIKLEDLYQKPHRWLFAVTTDETPASDYLQ